MRTGLVLPVLLAAGLVAALPGCRPDDQVTESLDARDAMRERESLPAPVVARLDSGSAAYRAGEYGRARGFYTAAAEAAPDFAAAWFGVYMAERALGNEAAAEAALARARSAAPGATLIHPTPADTLP